MKDFFQWIYSGDFPLYLAPMEGVTDSVFRRMCKKQGVDFLISEFISADALARDVAQSMRKMDFTECERPFGIQIFGHNEESLSLAARKAEEYQPDFIDINWGCPVKKVVSKGAGAAILQDIPKMVRLTRAVVESVAVPVTVKTRLGWDDSDKPIVEVSERLQDVGIAALTVHGRTRAQQYGGAADWERIGEVKANPRLRIPVIGNGDVHSGEMAVALKNRYGVDGIMVGRAAIGNPWIFQEIRHAVNGTPFSPPGYAERVATVLQQMEECARIKGERRTVLEIRLHYGGYFKAIPHFKERKMALMKAETLEECRKILEK